MIGTRLRLKDNFLSVRSGVANGRSVGVLNLAFVTDSLGDGSLVVATMWILRSRGIDSVLVHYAGNKNN